MNSEDAPANAENKPIVTDLMLNQPEPVSPAEKAMASVREIAAKLPDTLNAMGREISRTIERTIAAKDDYVVAIKLSPQAQDKLEHLVRAEVFKTRAEAAAFLIDEGIKAQGSLFERVQDKTSEIERLRAELRGSLKTEDAGAA
jgi:membrane peptidoglycan carboxypeptidase